MKKEKSGNINKKKIELTISIVNWNGKGVLKKCLKSIFQYDEGVELEVIVVDNASSDDSVSMIQKEFPQVVLIKNDENVGYGKANNKAFQISNGQFILILNPDIILTRPCLKEMLSHLKNNPLVGCVGCKLVNIDGSIQESYFDAFPTPWSQFKEGMMINRIYRMAFGKKIDATESLDVAWVVGACMMFYRNILFKLNGFDERYFMFGEDVDICYRTKKMGYKIVYFGNIEMFHYHAAVSRKQAKGYFSAVLQKESRYRFMRINYGMVRASLFRLFWILSGIIRTLILSPVLLISYLTFSKNRGFIFYTFQKYARTFSWGLGFEKWTRKEIPK